MVKPQSRRQKHTLLNGYSLFVNRLNLPSRRLVSDMRRRFYTKETALTVGLIAGLGLSLGTAQAFDNRSNRPLRRFNRAPISQTIKPTTPPAQASQTTVRVEATPSAPGQARAVINGQRVTLKSPQVVKRHYQSENGSSDVTVSFRQDTSGQPSDESSQTKLEIRSSSSVSADSSVNHNKTRGSP